MCKLGHESRRELKARLRRELIAQRKAMDKSDKSAADLNIFEQLKPYLDKAEAVFIYASTVLEVDTRRAIAYCLERGIRVALPVSGDSELDFFYIDRKDELVKGRYDIDEPPRLRPAVANSGTLCVVPALCADGNGLRLGYGKGYYDRFLSGFCGQSVILCYKSFIRDVPAEPHDIKADFTIFNR